MLEQEVEALREALARHAFDGGEVPCPDCPPVGCAGVEGRYQWERCEGLDIWLSTADLPARIKALEHEVKRVELIAQEDHTPECVVAELRDRLQLAEAVCEAVEAWDNLALDKALHSWREGRKG